MKLLKTTNSDDSFHDANQTGQNKQKSNAKQFEFKDFLPSLAHGIPIFMLHHDYIVQDNTSFNCVVR